MKNQRKDLQRQIADLIPLIELCLPIIEDFDQTQSKLKSLPIELTQLRKKAELLDSEIPLNSSLNLDGFDSRSHIESTEFELDFLVDNLEETLAYLTTLDYKIRNLLALKKRFEAIQEERIDGIALVGRIYKLLEQKQQHKANNINANSSSKTSHVRRVWQKILNHKKLQKIAANTAITLGIVLSFSIISYSSFKNLSKIRHNKVKIMQEKYLHFS